MITVTFDGVEYTKATNVAKQFGYTSDYLGQLCRAKKVNARLVGRSWFINVPSLEAHREKKYQPKKKDEQLVSEKTPVDIEVKGTDVAEKVPLTVKKPDTPIKKYLRRVPPPDAPVRRVSERTTEDGNLRHVSVSYESDDHSLIPKVANSKVTRLRVGIAGAEELKVHSGSTKVSFLKPSSLPDIALSGYLSVKEIPDGEYTNVEPEEEKVEEVVEESSTRDKLLNKLKMSFIDSDGNTHEEESIDTKEESDKSEISQKPDKQKKKTSKKDTETAKVRVNIKPEPIKGFKVKLKKAPEVKNKDENKLTDFENRLKNKPADPVKSIKHKKATLTVKVVEDIKIPVENELRSSVEVPVEQTSSQVQMIPIEVRMPVAGVVLGLLVGSLLLSAEQVVFVASNTADFVINFTWSNVSNMALVLFTG